MALPLPPTCPHLLPSSAAGESPPLSTSGKGTTWRSATAGTGFHAAGAQWGLPSARWVGALSPVSRRWTPTLPPGRALPSSSQLLGVSPGILVLGVARLRVGEPEWYSSAGTSLPPWPPGLGAASSWGSLSWGFPGWGACGLEAGVVARKPAWQPPWAVGPGRSAGSRSWACSLHRGPCGLRPCDRATCWGGWGWGGAQAAGGPCLTARGSDQPYSSVWREDETPYPPQVAAALEPGFGSRLQARALGSSGASDGDQEGGLGRVREGRGGL